MKTVPLIEYCNWSLYHFVSSRRIELNLYQSSRSLHMQQELTVKSADTVLEV